MADYPDITSTLPATVDIDWTSSRKIMVTEFENGTESRRAISGDTKKRITIRYMIHKDMLDGKTTDQALKILTDHYEDRGGPLKSFKFKLPATVPDGSGRIEWAKVRYDEEITFSQQSYFYVAVTVTLVTII